MAARRLVIVMLVLLAASTLAAALLPTPENREPAPTQPPRKQPPRPAEKAAEGGLLLSARMRLGRREPKTVRVQSGDQLRLAVTAPFGDDVEIPALGLTQPVTPFAPATFDLLATQRGTYPVRAVDSGLVAGRLVVGRSGSGRCGASRPEAPRGRGSIRSCGLRDRQQSQGRDRSARQP